MEQSELYQRLANMTTEELSRRYAGGGLTDQAREMAEAILRQRQAELPQVVSEDVGAEKPEIPNEFGDVVTGWVCVERHLSSFDAQLRLGILDSADIPCRLGDDNMNQLQLYSVATGGTRLLVPEAYADVARKLLAAEFIDEPVDSASLEATPQESGSRIGLVWGRPALGWVLLPFSGAMLLSELIWLLGKTSMGRGSSVQEASDGMVFLYIFHPFLLLIASVFLLKSSKAALPTFMGSVAISGFMLASGNFGLLSFQQLLIGLFGVYYCLDMCKHQLLV